MLKNIKWCHVCFSPWWLFLFTYCCGLFIYEGKKFVYKTNLITFQLYSMIKAIINTNPSHRVLSSFSWPRFRGRSPRSSLPSPACCAWVWHCAGPQGGGWNHPGRMTRLRYMICIHSPPQWFVYIIMIIFNTKQRNDTLCIHWYLYSTRVKIDLLCN